MKQNSITYLLLFLTTAVFFVGCGRTLLVTHPSPERGIPRTGGEYFVGAAKADITTTPGYPMAGYGIGGRFSRGYWSRLYARSISIEDNAGSKVVLVICDLWGMPAALAGKVAELVHQADPTIGREHIVIAATHTHNGPGNFASSPMYNLAASIDGGFDSTLFNYLSQQIAGSVIAATKNAQPARLSIGGAVAQMVSRNRSLEPFRANPERAQTESSSNPSGLASLNNLPSLVSDVEQLLAVDSTVTVLRFDPVDSTKHGPIAVAAFYSCHPTAMGPNTEVYSSDFFGVAANCVEQSLRKTLQESGPVVAIFNGAEGDISPNWSAQNIVSTLRLGRSLARGILSAAHAKQTMIHGPIRYRYEEVKISDRNVTDIHSDTCFAQPKGELKTAKKAVPGIATLGGAEDARTLFYNFGLREGIKDLNEDLAQGYKYPGVEVLLEKVVHLDSRPLRRLIASLIPADAPEVVGLGVYSLGDVVLATLPGEFTSTLGERISKTIRDSTNATRKPLLVGLANEYVSYFTTPCEYRLQHYEGSSTLYGEASGTFIETELGRISRTLNNRGTFKEDQKYGVGDEGSFGVRKLQERDGWTLEEGLSNLLLDPATGNPERRFPQLTWYDTLNTAEQKRQTPVVFVEEFNGSDWKVLVHPDAEQPDISVEETDTSSVNFVNVVQSGSARVLTWTSVWLTNLRAYGNSNLRLCIRKTNGVISRSERFMLEDVFGGRRSPKLKLETAK